MLHRDFKEFAELLDAHGVEYLLVGGYALAAFGHPRYTGDIDFWVSRAPENVARLLCVLNDFGFESMGLEARDFGPDDVIQLGHPPRRIDRLTTLDGVEFAECFARREQVVMNGTRLWLIGVEDFKSNKRATGRAKDLADLESLEGDASSDDDQPAPP